MTPKEQAQFDQDNEDLAQTVPVMTWRLYAGFKAEGFTPQQAFALCSEWVFGLAGGKRVSPPGEPT